MHPRDRALGVGQHQLVGVGPADVAAHLVELRRQRLRKRSTVV
jgi:hypothetical protein